MTSKVIPILGISMSFANSKVKFWQMRWNLQATLCVYFLNCLFNTATNVRYKFPVELPAAQVCPLFRYFDHPSFKFFIASRSTKQPSISSLKWAFPIASCFQFVESHSCCGLLFVSAAIMPIPSVSSAWSVSGLMQCSICGRSGSVVEQ